MSAWESKGDEQEPRGAARRGAKPLLLQALHTGDVRALVVHPGLSCLPTVAWLWGQGHRQSPPVATPAPRDLPGTAQTSPARWQEGLRPRTLQRQQTRFVLGEGLSVPLGDPTALGGCEPGAEPEPGTFVRQAFLLPAGIWTKTCNQQDRAHSHSSNTRGILRWKSFQKLQEITNEEHYSAAARGSFPRQRGPFSSRQELPFLPSPT